MDIALQQNCLMTSIKKVLGNNVAARRIKAGWTQKQLAAISGLAQASVSRVESGDESAADIETVDNLARAFAIKPWQLLAEEQTLVSELALMLYERLGSERELPLLGTPARPKKLLLRTDDNNDKDSQKGLPKDGSGHSNGARAPAGRRTKR